MEAGATLLLLCAALGIASTLSFYGDSISFMTPQRKAGTVKVTFYHRQNGRSSCEGQSSPFTCGSGACTAFNQSSVLQTDRDGTGRGRWCQSERATTAVLTNKTTFSLSGSGCCWSANVNRRTNWTSQAELNLGTRSDSHTFNSCPVTTTVSLLRAPQNCFSEIRLLAHDPDGDLVRCRFTSKAEVSSNFTLNETKCTLRTTGLVQIGVHVFEVMLEDFSTTNITLTYADGSTDFRQASNTTAPPLCKIKLQFLLEILPPIPNCAAGHVQPMFLSTTPSHGVLLYASVGQTFLLSAQAQAHHGSIHDFQVSGPQNMTKVFTDEQNGKAKVALSWTPGLRDLYRFVPVCFTAETNETQSEMRCIVVMVTQASITRGKATVQCSSNRMVVALEKASMPGIDANYLKLRDQSCSLTSNATHIMGSMSFATCGTKVEDKGDFLVFSNEVNSFVLPTEVIVRRETIKIDFSCQFPKTMSISSFYNLHKSDYIFTESSFGSFTYMFEIYRNSNFTEKVEASAYPVEVKLLDMIYLGIQAQSELSSVKLFVESCKATPDDNPDNTLFYDIIKNGCLQDETVKVHPSNQTSFNFEVQAFKFTGNYDQVYITCAVILCEANSPFSRCAQGCLRDTFRRRRALSKETVRHSISQGPLQFVDQDVSTATVDGDNSNVLKKSDASAAAAPAPVSPGGSSVGSGRWQIRELLSTNISTIVFASCFLASLVLMAVIVRHFTRRKAEDLRALMAPGWDD